MSTANGTEIRENIEWISIRWHDADSTEKKLKRALLVGDSIVNGHGTMVHNLVREEFCVDFFATAKHVTDIEYMPDLEFMLAKHNYDVILFNNGLHGFGIEDELYQPALRSVLTELKSRTRSLAWRTSTPMLKQDDLTAFNPDKTPRILRRNADAEQVADELGLPVLDLYGPMSERKDLFCPDAVHYSEEGKEFQAEIVAEFLRKLMVV